MSLRGQFSKFKIQSSGMQREHVIVWPPALLQCFVCSLKPEPRRHIPGARILHLPVEVTLDQGCNSETENL